MPSPIKVTADQLRDKDDFSLGVIVVRGPRVVQFFQCPLGTDMNALQPTNLVAGKRERARKERAEAGDSHKNREGMT